MTFIFVLIIAVAVWHYFHRERGAEPKEATLGNMFGGKDPWNLDFPLFQWSPFDVFTLKNAVEAVCIMGELGAAKSTGSAGSVTSAGSAGRTPSRTPAWRNRRSRLVNVAFFGIGPLVLAGVVVAAFLLVAPGKGSASSLGFQAGPGATAQSSASAPASPSASPSPAAHAKHRARSTPSSSVAKVPTIATAKPKPKTTPKPAHTSSGGGGGVTPHNLGLPNFAGYCQHIGDRTAVLTASNAYGWHCALYPTRVLEVTTVCAWSYGLSTSQVVSVSTNYSDPEAWQCWRVNRDLGVLNVTQYCVGAGLGTSELVADNAYGWDCTKPVAAVNTTAACDAVYHVSDAVARFAVFADPYSWQCWN